MNTRLIIKGTSVYEPVTIHGLFQGYVALPVTQGEPTLSWLGGKIALPLWRSVLSFFDWSHRTHRSEAQVRLFYHEGTRQWDAWAFPQEHGGMTTKEIAGHDFDEQRQRYDGTWTEAGTVHHHCGMSAFQSGTDSHDESTRNGIHLTVGNLGSQRLSIHSRVAFSHNGAKSFYNGDLAEWFDVGAFPAGLSPTTEDAICKDLLTLPNTTEPFPALWQDNVKSRQWSVAVTNHHGNWNGSSWEPAGNGKLTKKEKKQQRRQWEVQSEAQMVTEAMASLQDIGAEYQLSLSEVVGHLEYLKEVKEALWDAGFYDIGDAHDALVKALNVPPTADQPTTIDEVYNQD